MGKGFGQTKNTAESNEKRIRRICFVKSVFLKITEQTESELLPLQ